MSLICLKSSCYQIEKGIIMNKSDLKLKPFLKISHVKHNDFLFFGLLVFKFFKTSKNRNILLLGIPNIANFLIVFPYILKIGLFNLRRKCYFVRLEKHFVGTFSVSEEPNSIRIHSLTVNPQYRKLGIATYILNYVEEQAVCAKKNYLELSVRIDNNPALRLYRNFGFIVIKEDRWFFLLKKKI